VRAYRTHLDIQDVGDFFIGFRARDQSQDLTLLPRQIPNALHSNTFRNLKILNRLRQLGPTVTTMGAAGRVLSPPNASPLYQRRRSSVNSLHASAR
jgi:hypothetical protein